VTSPYDEVKRRIIELRYPPGTKLAEARLAEELGCGRSPIRSAFARLRSEGWIDVSPQSGTYVRSLSEREIHDLFECRLLLETHVTRLAARNMDAGEVRKLRIGLRGLKRRGNGEPAPELFDDFNDFDSLFHATIYRAAGNAVIAEILLNLLEKAQWLKKSSPSTPRRMKLWFAELERVLEAIEARDADAAAEGMRRHIGNAADYGAQARRQRAGLRGKVAA